MIHLIDSDMRHLWTFEILLSCCDTEVKGNRKRVKMKRGQIGNKMGVDEKEKSPIRTLINHMKHDNLKANHLRRSSMRTLYITGQASATAEIVISKFQIISMFK